MWLTLNGAHNARDLGGLATPTGRTRSRLLFRSDSLDRLTDDDVRLLTSELGLKTIIDLRSPREHPTTEPAWWTESAIDRFSIPLLEDASLDLAVSGRPLRIPNLEELYRSMLAGAGRSFAQILSLLATTDRTPALLHCAAGKDRTGVAIAVLLAAVSVERDAIVADYAATNERMDRVIGALQTTGYQLPAADAAVRELLTAPGPVMVGILDHLHDWPGGATGYLLANGASEESLAAWRMIFVEERDT
jgi:protein-tyrosine phosphatase